MNKTKRNTKRIIIIAVSWLLAVLCAAVIFKLSGQNGSDSQELSDEVNSWLSVFLGKLLDIGFVRKSAHFFEYCGFSLLVFNAFYQTFGRFRPLLTLLTTVIYSISDEIHQYFVPERACRFFDVFVDFLGALTGLAICFALITICKNIKERMGKK